MFKRILVPLDGSDRAEQAIPVAARIARASGGTVILVQATPSPVDFRAEKKLLAEVYSENVIEEVKALAINYLDNARRMAELVGVQTETRVEYGDVAPSILAAVEALEVDLIVMCSHGYSGLKRLVMGSVAENVARHATVPLLLLRDEGPGLTQARSGGPSSMSILVPLDGSVRAEAAIGPAMQLIEALSAPARGLLRLARVVILPDANKTSLSERETIMQEAKTYLSSIAERIQAERVAGLNLAVSWCVTIDDDLAGGISQCKLGFHQVLFSRVLEVEAELPAHSLHLLVFSKDVAGEVLDFFIAPELDQLAQQLGSQPLALERVGDEQGNLGTLLAVGFDEAAYPNNLVLPGLGIVVVGDECHLPIVVNEA